MYIYNDLYLKVYLLLDFGLENVIKGYFVGKKGSLFL